MKKIFLFLIFIVFVNLPLFARNIANEENIDILDDADYLTIRDGGFVPNEKVAEKIADVILTSIYGDRVIKENKPYKICLKDGVWYIEGILKDKDLVGGVPYIKIRKSDGAILGVIHTR